MFGILVSGASISFGRGESPNIGWSGRLKKYVESQGFNNCLYNLGIPGDTTTTLLKRFGIELKARIKYVRPIDKFVVMIGIGTNDSKGLGSPDKLRTKQDKFEKNIFKLIKITKKYTKNIVIVGITPVNEDMTNPIRGEYFINKRIKEYNQILKKCAKKEKVYYINIFNPIFKLNYKKLLADGIHPNSRGYEEIYKIIKKFLTKKKLIGKSLTDTKFYYKIQKTVY